MCLQRADENATFNPKADEKVRSSRTFGLSVTAEHITLQVLSTFTVVQLFTRDVDWQFDLYSTDCEVFCQVHAAYLDSAA